LGNQATVPPQDGARRDQPVRPQPSRQEPDQRGQHRPVGPSPTGRGAVLITSRTSEDWLGGIPRNRGGAAWPRMRSPG